MEFCIVKSLSSQACLDNAHTRKSCQEFSWGCKAAGWHGQPSAKQSRKVPPVIIQPVSPADVSVFFFFFSCRKSMRQLPSSTARRKATRRTRHIIRFSLIRQASTKTAHPDPANGGKQVLVFQPGRIGGSRRRRACAFYSLARSLPREAPIRSAIAIRAAHASGSETATGDFYASSSRRDAGIARASGAGPWPGLAPRPLATWTRRGRRRRPGRAKRDEASQSTVATSQANRKTAATSERGCGRQRRARPAETERPPADLLPS